MRASTFSREEPGGARIARYPSSDYLVFFSMIDVHVDRDICVFRWLPTHAIIPGGHGLGLRNALHYLKNRLSGSDTCEEAQTKNVGSPLPSRTISSTCVPFVNPFSPSHPPWGQDTWMELLWTMRRSEPSHGTL